MLFPRYCICNCVCICILINIRVCICICAYKFLQLGSESHLVFQIRNNVKYHFHITFSMTRMMGMGISLPWDCLQLQYTLSISMFSWKHEKQTQTVSWVFLGESHLLYPQSSTTTYVQLARVVRYMKMQKDGKYPLSSQHEVANVCLHMITYL